MPEIDRLIAVATSRQHSFPPPIPKLGVAVLTCMDARIGLNSLLGLAIGDAHMLRNAGGMATDDVVESLAISQNMVGTTHIMVIHHTNCLAHGDRAPGLTPMETVQWTVEKLRADPRLPHRDNIRGFVLDTVGDGSLVEAETRVAS